MSQISKYKSHTKGLVVSIAVAIIASVREFDKLPKDAQDKNHRRDI